MQGNPSNPVTRLHLSASVFGLGVRGGGGTPGWVWFQAGATPPQKSQTRLQGSVGRSLGGSGIPDLPTLHSWNKG